MQTDRKSRVPARSIGPPELVDSLRGRRLPMPAMLAGYSALIHAFDLRVPLPGTMAAIAPKNTRLKEDGWVVYPSSSRPLDNPVDHLVFALKYEGVQLLVLKKFFEVLDKSALEASARAKPLSAYLRRICFLYEWLMQTDLDVPNTASGAYVDVVDVRLQYGVEADRNSTRFRIRNNLPGSHLFCPMVFRTRRLDAFLALDLETRAKDVVSAAPSDLIARAAAFMLLSDSKASFDIEGERPSKDRVARWGAVLGKAGDIAFNVSSLIDLQRIVVGDDRFVQLGLRREGGFVGRHDTFGQPVPEHVSAKYGDLDQLLLGMEQFDTISSKTGFHPVLAAACIAFGFVYIHPFEDGNGRLHRFLMHHVLAERHFTPPGLIFPISSVILNDIVRYREVLRSVSKPLLEWIDWIPTPKGNVDVLTDTTDYYRYFDATAHSEYLFECVEQTVTRDLPAELAFLENRDVFHREATQVVDMSEQQLDLLIRFLRQNQGTLSKRARTGPFALLHADEIETIESLYRDLFHSTGQP